MKISRNHSYRLPLRLVSCLFITLIYFSLVSAASTKNIYISQNGSGSGTSCDDAHSADWFNAQGTVVLNGVAHFNVPTNWGSDPNQINPGDTVHLCGTISDTLYVQENGTPGNSSTILFEPDAKLSTGTWGTNLNVNAIGELKPAIYGLDVSDFIVDGGANGVIEATDNGLNGNGKTFGHYQPAYGVCFSGALTNVEIKSLTIKNIVQSWASPDMAVTGDGINISGVLNNINIHHNTLDMIGNGIILAYYHPTSYNVFIASNTITRNSWGMFINSADPNGADAYGFEIYNNRIDKFDDWVPPYGPARNQFHSDCIILNVGGGGTGVNHGIKIYRNYLGPNLAQMSSPIYLSPDYSTEYDSPLIFNNLIVAGPNTNPTNGFIMQGGTNAYVMNNTFISFISVTGGPGGGGLGMAGYGHVFNNAFYNLGNGVMTHLGHIAECDYNAYDTATTFVDGGFLSYPDWKNLNPTFDLHSSTIHPHIDPNFMPTGIDTALRAQGINLSSYFNTDLNGNPRPTSGPWTIGAFEYDASRDLPIRAIPEADLPAGYDSLLVTFNGGNSYRLDGGAIASYHWTFDDGSTDDGITVNHRFHEGVHVASLTVTGTGTGTTNTANIPITVFHSIYPDLNLYLPFDSSIQDVSGKSVDTLWSGIESYATGVVCKAAVMDGHSRVDVPYSGAAFSYVEGFKQLTFAFWAKKNTPLEANYILAHNTVYTMSLSSTGFNATLIDSNYQPMGTVSAYQGTDNTDWHHYALTYDGSTSLLFFDGVQVASQAMSGIVNRGAYQMLSIGGYFNTTPSFDGKLDDVRIYGRSLSSSEVKALHDNALANPNVCLTAPSPTPTPTLTPGTGTSEVKFASFKNVFNPAKGEIMTISYQLASNVIPDINIYDKKGNKIQTLNGTSFQATWDGRNQSGESVSAGIYIVTLKSNGTLIKKKIVVIK